MDDSSAIENGSPPDPILQELLALAAATAGGPSRAAAARVEAMRRLATMAAPAVEPVPSRLRAADADAAIAMARELHTVRVYIYFAPVSRTRHLGISFPIGADRRWG
jgi:hypothetical protein